MIEKLRNLNLTNSFTCGKFCTNIQERFWLWEGDEKLRGAGEVGER